VRLGEPCGVYRRPPYLVWDGPYNDAAVFDEVFRCWVADLLRTVLFFADQCPDG
jgi:hypothetical protein